MTWLARHRTGGMAWAHPDAAAGRDPDDPRAGLAWLGLERLEDMRRSQDQDAQLRVEIREQVATLRTEMAKQDTDLRRDIKEQIRHLQHWVTTPRADLRHSQDDLRRPPGFER